LGVDVFMSIKRKCTAMSTNGKFLCKCAAGWASDDRVKRRNAKRPPEFRLRQWLFFFQLFFCWSVGAFCSKSVSPADKSLSRFLSYGTSEAPLLIFNESVALQKLLPALNS
jgi:hypothetical protein